jgi:hypothetical protein
MNCQDRELMMEELARERLLEAATCDALLAHIAACACCAARLADERGLTAGLRALAASVETKQAPPRLETALRAAFREQFNQASQPASAAPAPWTPARRNARRWTRWVAMAAAAALVVIALSALRWGWSSGDNVERTGLPSSAPVPAQVPNNPAPPLTVPDEPKPELVRQSERQPVPKGLRPAARRGPAEGEAGDLEIVTGFFPLTYAGDLAALESGHVLRIEMPRSALVSFGLPMNMERAQETVKADVVVGTDGLARAIRFVH